MTQLTQEQMQKAAEFIVKHAENPEIKKLVSEKGYKIIPNKMKYILEGLEKAGYKVLRQSDYEELIGEKSAETNQENTQEVESIDTSSEKQTTELIENTPLFGGRNVETIEEKNEEPSKEVTNEVTPSPKDILNTNNFFDENITSDTQTEMVTEEEDKEEEEELSPLQKNWYKVLDVAKEKGVAFYSLIYNANLLSLEDDKLKLGFGSQYTYQMKQLKREDNQKVFKDILKALLGNDYIIELEVSDEKSIVPKRKQPKTKPEENKEYSLFGGREENISTNNIEGGNNNGFYF